MAFARYVQQMVETLGAEGTLSFVQAQIAAMAQPEPALKVELEAEPAEPAVPPVAVAVPLPAEPEPAKKVDRRSLNGKKSNFLNDDFQKMCDAGIIPLNTRLFYKPGKKSATVFYEGIVGRKYLPGGKTDFHINSGTLSSSSPSGFASNIRKYHTPDVSPAVDGWAFVKIGGEKGPALKEARELWKAGKIEEAKALFA
jgi:hypothetical protein